METKYIVFIICFILLGGFLAWISVKSQKEAQNRVEQKPMYKLSVRKQLRLINKLSR